MGIRIGSSQKKNSAASSNDNKNMMMVSNKNNSTPNLIQSLKLFALGAFATSLFYKTQGTGYHRSQENKRGPGNAWTLAITMTFSDESDLQYILDEWKMVTKYCQENEPFLLHYEGGKMDSDPLKLHMLERYASKDDYLNKHKQGSEFLKFRPKLKKLQDEGKVTVEGYSYQELGVGFV